MCPLLWIKVLMLILELIARGLSKTTAESLAAKAFGVSASVIRAKMD